MLSNKRAAVLDLTHGGAVIARKLTKIADSVTGIDVYRTLSREELDSLELEGIATSQAPLDVSGFDVIIAPVHLDPSYQMLADAVRKKVPVISHHEAVGEISRGALENAVVVEITGTKAKTSTAALLAGILSHRKKVITHTSRGVEDWSNMRMIRKGLSITPASILGAMDAAAEAGLRPDIFIFEVSLGGSGNADFGIITTIAGDYRIANNTRSASEAKRSMILNAKPGSAIVINHDALRSFGACRRDVSVVSFSDSVNAAANVYYEKMGTGGGVIAFYLNGRTGRITIEPSRDYDIVSYKTAFACAAAAALAMGVAPYEIERSIREFKGAGGRMNRTNLAGRTLVDNSNSGMDIKSAEKALEYAKGIGGNVVMVLGEEAKEVCEGLDPAGVERFIDMRLDELKALVLVGERMKPLVSRDVNKIYHAGNLSEGIEMAQKLSQDKDIILSCVKCFR